VIRTSLLLLAGLPAFASFALAEGQSRLDCRVHEVTASGRLATCTARIGAQHPEWTWVLVGEPPDRITRIEIYEPGKDEPRQVLDGLDERPALRRDFGGQRGSVAFVLEDVNFDGVFDLRLQKGPADEAGVPFRWWLFDKTSGQFVPSPALDGVRSPAVNVKRRLLIGTARDEQGRHARIFYRWREGQLAPVAAEAVGRTEHGACVRSHYTMKDGKFEKLRETECAPRREEE
jgi:hypothetical protein